MKNNQLLSSNTSNSSSSDTSRSTQTGSKSHRNAAQSSERRGSFNHNNNHTQPGKGQAAHWRLSGSSFWVGKGFKSLDGVYCAGDDEVYIFDFVVFVCACGIGCHARFYERGAFSHLLFPQM